MGYRSDIGAVISVDGWSGNKAEESGAPQWTKYKEMVGLIKLSKFYELMQQAEVDRNCIGWHWGVSSLRQITGSGIPTMMWSRHGMNYGRICKGSRA